MELKALLVDAGWLASLAMRRRRPIRHRAPAVRRPLLSLPLGRRVNCLGKSTGIGQKLQAKTGRSKTPGLSPALELCRPLEPTGPTEEGHMNPAAMAPTTNG